MEYEDLRAKLNGVIAGEENTTARFATAACLIHQKFGFFWTGFYVVDGEELVIGPYQGTMGCLRIPFTKGVCGMAARTRETVLVPDVHNFPGHIACDSRSKSEIVVPVFKDGVLMAVLDIDSTELNRFTSVDQQGLEAICADLLSVP